MDETRRAYGAIAPKYIELFGSLAAVHTDDLALTRRHLSLRPGTVLDAGCGPGHLTAYLHSQNVDAIGIDVVPEFIEHARTAHPNGRYVLGSLEDLPVGSNSLAGILAWYSLIHLPPDHLDQVLAELRRAMIPSGRLVVGFFDGNSVSAFAHKVTTAHFWPIDEMADRLRQAGFSEVERARRTGSDETRTHAALAAVAD